RPMGSRGRLAACQDLGDVGGITLRRVFFVLFAEMPRVRASISRTPLVLRGIRHLYVRGELLGVQRTMTSCSLVKAISLGRKYVERSIAVTACRFGTNQHVASPLNVP